MKWQRNIYIIIVFLCCLNSVYGFTDNNGEYILQKATLGAKVINLTNDNYSVYLTVLTPPVGNQTSSYGEICIGWYCIQPSEGVVVEVIEEVLGAVGATGACPAGYYLVLYEGSYYCADGKTIQRLHQRRFNLYLIVTLLILFFLFKRRKKKRRRWLHER